MTTSTKLGRKKIIIKDKLDSEIALLSCLIADTTLFSDTQLDFKQFKEEKCRKLAKVLQKLSNANVQKPDDLDIFSALPKKDKERSDIKQLLSVAKTLTPTDPEKVEYILDKHFKYVNCLELNNMNFNIFEPIEIEKGDKDKIIPYQQFKDPKINSSEVLDFPRFKIDQINTVLDRDVVSTDFGVSDDFIDDLLEGFQKGVPFSDCGVDIHDNPIIKFPRMSENSLGLIESKMSLLAGYSGVGKSSLMLTMIVSLIEQGEKVCLHSNEENKSDFMIKLLLWVIRNKLGYKRLYKKRLLNGKVNLSSEELTLLKQAQKIVNEQYKNNVKFYSTTSSNMDKITKLFDKARTTMGSTVFIHDTFKINIESNSDQTWLGMKKEAEKFHNWIKTKKVIGICTAQCASHTKGQLFLDEGMLSSSKQVIEILTNCWLMRNVYAEELDPESPKYIRPFEYQDGPDPSKQIRKEVIIDQNKNYIVNFTSKTRNGINSEVSGVAILLENDLGTGTLTEVCYCQPKRGFIRNENKKK